MTEHLADAGEWDLAYRYANKGLKLEGTNEVLLTQVGMCYIRKAWTLPNPFRCRDRGKTPSDSSSAPSVPPPHTFQLISDWERRT